MSGRRPPPDPAKPRSIDRRELNAIEAAREKTKPAPPRPAQAEPSFAELVSISNYSFLHGASHPADLVGEAIALGLKAIGLADRNSVAGAVRAYVALRDAPEKARAELLEGKKARGEPERLTPEEEAGCETDLRLIVGARLVFVDGTPDIIVYPASRQGWGKLTRLLTKGNIKAIKGDCILHFADLLDYLDDWRMIILPLSTAQAQQEHDAPPDYAFEDEAIPVPSRHLRLVPPASPPSWQEAARQLQDRMPGRVWLGLSMRYQGRDARHVAMMQAVSRDTGIPLIATNDILYATSGTRPLQDVLTCIREGVTLKTAGTRLQANAERHMKSPTEMARLFAVCPDAFAETIRFIDGIDFTLKNLAYEYPHEPVPAGWSPDAWLEDMVRRRARRRYGRQLPPKVRALIGQELRLIRRQNYAYYFLTVHDLVRFARAQKPPILCQGRGSAANSIVCFLLGVTSIDPMEHDLLFSRFVSEERNEPPDIDVDFEHERREEVMQYIYRRYGRARAGIAATVIHYRSRSALREVAKVLGVSEDVVMRL